MDFLVSEGMSEGTLPFSLKIFNKKIWPISTSGERTICSFIDVERLTIKIKRFIHHLKFFTDWIKNLVAGAFSPEVETCQIFLLNIFNENGKVPSDIPSDTKNSIRVVH